MAAIEAGKVVTIYSNPTPRHIELLILDILCKSMDYMVWLLKLSP